MARVAPFIDHNLQLNTIYFYSTMINSVTISIRSFGNPSPEADRGIAFQNLLDSIGIKIEKEKFSLFEPNPLKICHVADISNGSVHKALNDNYEVVVVINQEQDEFIRSPAVLDVIVPSDIQEQSPPVLPEHLIARNHDDFDAINDARIAAEGVALHIIGKPFDEHQMSIFVPLARDYIAFLMSGKANMSVKTSNEQDMAELPRGQFVPLSDGSLGYIRNDLTAEEMDSIPICRRIRSGEMHFISEFIDIREQGFETGPTTKSPIKKKSFVRAHFRQKLSNKNYNKIIKIQKHLENIKIQKKKKKKNNRSPKKNKIKKKKKRG